MVAAKSWSNDHRDMKGALLYAPLAKSDKVWINLLSISSVLYTWGAVGKLQKLLYELRQAPKIWYVLLAKLLQKIGFHHS